MQYCIIELLAYMSQSWIVLVRVPFLLCYTVSLFGKNKSRLMLIDQYGGSGGRHLYGQNNNTNKHI